MYTMYGAIGWGFGSNYINQSWGLPGSSSKYFPNIPIIYVNSSTAAKVRHITTKRASTATNTYNPKYPVTPNDITLWRDDQLKVVPGGADPTAETTESSWLLSKISHTILNGEPISYNNLDNLLDWNVIAGNGSEITKIEDGKYQINSAGQFTMELDPHPGATINDLWYCSITIHSVTSGTGITVKNDTNTFLDSASGDIEERIYLTSDKFSIETSSAAPTNIVFSVNLEPIKWIRTGLSWAGKFDVANTSISVGSTALIALNANHTNTIYVDHAANTLNSTDGVNTVTTPFTFSAGDERLIEVIAGISQDMLNSDGNGAETGLTDDDPRFQIGWSDDDGTTWTYSASQPFRGQFPTGEYSVAKLHLPYCGAGVLIPIGINEINIDKTSDCEYLFDVNSIRMQDVNDNWLMYLC